MASFSPYASAVLADAPVGYWPCTDLVGSTTLKDRSGNGRDLTIGGSPTLESSGPYGDRAIAFSATSQYAVGAAATALAPSNITWEFFVYTTTATGKTAFGKFENNGGSPGDWGFDTNGTGATPRIYLIKDASGDLWRSASWPSALALNTWAHLAASFDAGTNTWACYLNGAAVAHTASGPVGSRQAATDRQVSLGRFSALYNSDAWQGRLCHFAVYGSVLSAARIAAHYQEALRRGVIY